jgi:glutamine amidotransferase PdxT
MVLGMNRYYIEDRYSHGVARTSVDNALDVDRLATVIEDFNTVFIRLPSVQRLNFSALSVLHSLSRGGRCGSPICW